MAWMYLQGLTQKGISSVVRFHRLLFKWNTWNPPTNATLWEDNTQVTWENIKK